MNRYLLIIASAQSPRRTDEFYLSESFLYLNKLMFERHHGPKARAKMVIEIVKALSMLGIYRKVEVFNVNIRKVYLKAWKEGDVDRYVAVAFYKLKLIYPELENLLRDYAEEITNSRTS